MPAMPAIVNTSDYYSCTVYALQFQDTLPRGWLKHSHRVQISTAPKHSVSHWGRDTLQHDNGCKLPLCAGICPAVALVPEQRSPPAQHVYWAICSPLSTCYIAGIEYHDARVAAKHYVHCRPWLQSLAILLLAGGNLLPQLLHVQCSLRLAP